MVDQTANSGSSGAGQQDPGTSNSDFTVATFIVRQMLAKLDTMKPVKVVKVTGGGGAIAKAGTVDVQLLVSQLDGSANSTPNGVVHNIPWWRMQGGKNAVICDPLVGDIGFVMCADRDISNLKAAVAGDKDPMVPPGSFRKFNVADGIYVGGMLNGVPEQYLAFSESGIVWTDRHGNVIKSSSTGIDLTPASGLPVTVNGSLIVTQNLQLGGTVLAQNGGPYAGTISTSGNIVSQGVNLKTHTHTQPNDSRGDIEAPTNPPS